jgi:hypothetical protein
LSVRARWSVRVGLALGAAAALAAAGGCSSERPPVGGDGTRPAVTTGGPARFVSDAGLKPPGCGMRDDGSECECLDVPLYVDPPTLYFVLDRSGSMEADGKWTQTRVTVGRIMRSLGPRANFGATIFPGTSANSACAPGTEIMPVRSGDPPSSGVDGPTTTALLSATRVAPTGGTPTAVTLEVVRTKLGSIGGRVFVILATDGAPNCNAAATCNHDGCQLNIDNFPGCPREGPSCCDPQRDGFREHCNDASATLGAITALRSSGVPVYVLGLPGTGPYASLLDQMATAGGTAQPGARKYFAVDTASEAVMLAALRKIAAQIAGTCEFELREEPANPALVNVYVDDAPLPFEPVNGWSIDGRRVTLLGTACERIKSGDVLDVRIIAGCPRIAPR